MLELLAPSGDIKSFDTAIACGADAVYLGLKQFNARAKAQNFDEQTLVECVKKAHFYGVKVYVAINTILHNHEFVDLFDMVKMAVDAKVDAFIVQDLGVLTALKKAFDNIEIHTSTQLGVHNLLGAQMACELGAKRVVLSRESKLKDIEKIHKNTPLDIECFVQGALCVCFSGNCYLSAIEQDASGNRGLCKQLCRLPYEAKIDKFSQKGFLLSARDLCLAPTLEELVEVGVNSFKIEGRMRREGYVGVSVATYRKLLDSLQQGKSVKLADDSLLSLKKVFNRGKYLSRAYLDGGVPKIVDKRFSNHVGVVIGNVKSVKPFKDDLYEITLVSKHNLKKGDGLKFFDGYVEKASLGIGEPTKVGDNLYKIVSKTKVKAGWQVNLIFDAALEGEVAKKVRTLSIDMSVNALVGKPLQIEVSAKCGDKVIAVVLSSDTPLERALNAPMSEDALCEQCSKVGDSGFAVEKCSVNTDGVFVAKSVLNALRRDALATLKEKIIEFYEPKECVFDKSVASEFLAIERECESINDVNLHYVTSEDLRGSVFVKKGEKVVLCPSVYTVAEICRMLSLLDLQMEEVALELPPIANGDDLEVIDNLLEELAGLKTLVSENIYGLSYAKRGYSVIAGCGHNASNTYAIYALKELGASAVCLSLEAGGDVPSPLPRANGGKMPLMTFAHCPYKTLFDNDCTKCSYKEGLTLTREKKVYSVRRVRVAQCYFQLW